MEQEGSWRFFPGWPGKGIRRCGAPVGIAARSEESGELIDIDSRPSDAIALGVANETPIFVEEHVLDEVCRTE